MFTAIVIFVYLLSIIFYFTADYFTNEGINDAVLYHLRYGLTGAGFFDYYIVAIMTTLSIFASFLVSFYFYKKNILSSVLSLKTDKKIFPFTLIIIAFAFNPTIQTFFALSSTMVTQHLHADKLLLFDKSNMTLDIPRDNPLFNSQDIDFLSHYTVPKTTDNNQSHPNFIYIYAESLEQTYFDETIFPGLIKGLREVQKKHTYFTDINQIKGSGWTIAGMLSSQCALPLITPSFTAVDGNAMNNMNTFYGGATCLGDILSQYGYYLSFLQGSSIEFAGVGKFYETHSFNEINNVFKNSSDLNISLSQSMNAWGLYDDDLLNIAYNEALRLFSTKKPAGIFIATIDTHHPDGHVSKSCANIQYQDGSNPILNSVACADFLITNFVNRIQASEYGDNTIIYISSDHLAMKNSATDLLDKGNRRNLFMIIDPHDDKNLIVDKKGAMIDVAPTVLHKLGFQNTDFGLGHNLLSSSGSLLAKVDNIDNKIADWSPSLQKFWNFPQITKTLDISKINNTIQIDKYTYKYPLLLKLDGHLKTSVYSEFSSPKKLYEYLADFDSNTSFVWIDKCHKISSFDFTVNPYSDSCFLAGKLGGKLIGKNISEEMSLSKETLDELANDKPNEMLFNQRLHYLIGLYLKEHSSFTLSEETNEDKENVKRFIAHAGGKIDGHAYTDSLEALNFSYSNGFRLFELDIIKTSDNIYVAAHDWEYWASITGYSGDLPPTLNTFKKYKIHNLYTPLDINAINQWFLTHPDAILVTDKVNTPLDFSKHFVDKKRLMMELFTLDAVKEGITSNIKSAMPSWRVLKEIKNDQANVLASMGITDIAASRRVIKENLPLIKQLDSKGIQTYVFHVNFDEGKDETYVVCNDMRYIYGLYADKWDFNTTVDCR